MTTARTVSCLSPRRYVFSSHSSSGSRGCGGTAATGGTGRTVGWGWEWGSGWLEGRIMKKGDHKSGGMAP